MSIIIPGREFALVFFVILTAAILYLTESAKTKNYPLKRLPAYDAITEAVGRAAELGRPVLCHCGQRDLNHPEAAATLAALSILSYVAKLCAEMGVRLIVPTMMQTVYPLQVERVREAYMAAGRSEAFDETDIRFLSPHHQAYAAGVIAIMEREEVAANIMVGQWSGITLVIAENSNRLGCFGIGGTDQPSNIPFFIPTMDYVIIGEEMFALGSYIEKNPQDVGTIVAKDVMKMITIFVIVAGVVLTALGVNFVSLIGG
jgi:hypothetical protein